MDARPFATVATTQPRRSWLKRAALAVVAVGAVALLAFLFLPLPIGWAVNLAAGSALPPHLQARVSAGTFRWRFGAESLEIRLDNIAVTVADRPLATIGGVRVEVDKAAARGGHYAPRLLEVIAPQIVIDTSAGSAIDVLVSSPATRAPEAGTPAAPGLKELE